VKRIIAATIGGVGLALVVPQTAYAATANRSAEHRSDVTYTMSDVKAHATAQSCWTAVNDKVYDLTAWLPTHAQVTAASVCGIDSTQVFKPTKVKPVHTSSSDDDGDNDSDHRGSQHRNAGAAKAMSHDDDEHGYGTSNGQARHESKSLYKSIKHFRIGHLAMVATTPPVVTPPVVTPPTTPPPVTPPAVTSYTIAQIAPHNTAANCWTAIGTNVYNLTSYISTHPGGVGTISALCGTNGTTKFNNQHAGATNPAAILTGLKVGVLV
jgi:cytochrome b involved in lipid metabolism